MGFNYECDQERNDQVVMMILNMEQSSLENQNKNSKYSSVFVIFGPVIGEGQWYDDASSKGLKCICELFGNILFFYSMKLCLDICKTLVDVELIYKLSSLANCCNLHVLRSYWINMSLVHV